MARDWFRDCGKCGAKCCRFFGIPADRGYEIHAAGVPLDIYSSPSFEGQPLDPDPARYFRLREGITVDGDRLIVAREVETRSMRIRRCMPTRREDYIIVYSKCTKLGNGGECTIYPNRPAMCRNFVARTAHLYLVPERCIFDPGGCGEDFGI